MKSVLFGFGLGIAAGMLLTKNNRSVQRVVTEVKEAVSEKLSGESKMQCGCPTDDM